MTLPPRARQTLSDLSPRAQAEIVGAMERGLGWFEAWSYMLDRLCKRGKAMGPVVRSVRFKRKP